MTDDIGSNFLDLLLSRVASNLFKAKQHQNSSDNNYNSEGNSDQEHNSEHLQHNNNDNNNNNPNNVTLWLKLLTVKNTFHHTAWEYIINM